MFYRCYMRTTSSYLPRQNLETCHDKYARTCLCVVLRFFGDFHSFVYLFTYIYSRADVCLYTCDVEMCME